MYKYIIQIRVRFFFSPVPRSNSIDSIASDTSWTPSIRIITICCIPKNASSHLHTLERCWCKNIFIWGGFSESSHSGYFKRAHYFDWYFHVQVIISIQHRGLCRPNNSIVFFSRWVVVSIQTRFQVTDKENALKNEIFFTSGLLPMAQRMSWRINFKGWCNQSWPFSRPGKEVYVYFSICAAEESTGSVRLTRQLSSAGACGFWVFS